MFHYTSRIHFTLYVEGNFEAPRIIVHRMISFSIVVAKGFSLMRVEIRPLQIGLYTCPAPLCVLQMLFLNGVSPSLYYCPMRVFFQSPMVIDLVNVITRLR